jgi:hypothetical protein
MTRHFAGVLALFVLLTGCRTYGEYDSEALMYRQLEQAVAEFESLSAEFDARQGALSGRVPHDEIEELNVRRQQFVLDYQQALETLSESSGHRELRRMLGSVITDRQIIEERMQRLERRAMPQEDTLHASWRLSDPRSQYGIVPVFYHRVAAADGRVAPERGVEVAEEEVDVDFDTAEEAAPDDQPPDEDAAEPAEDLDATPEP